jgi:hypothetical protein
MAAVAVGALLVVTSAGILATVLVVEEDCVRKMNAQCLL